jgi:hypothetical protein
VTGNNSDLWRKTVYSAPARPGSIGQATFVVGAVTSVDADKKTVAVHKLDQTTAIIPYDALLICSGNYNLNLVVFSVSFFFSSSSFLQKQLTWR